MNKILQFFVEKVYARTNILEGDISRVDFRPVALPAERDIFVYVGNIINWALGLVGLIAFIVVLYAGFNLLTAGADPEKAKKSKEMLMYALAGIILILLSYSIASYFTASSSPILGN